MAAVMVALCPAFTPSRMHASVVSQSGPGRGDARFSIVERRAFNSAALGAAALAFVAVCRPAYANTVGLIEDQAGTYDKAINKNSQGDASLYTPSAKIVTKGSKSAKVEISMPSPGPLSQKDYIDLMWFRDIKSGSVVAAQGYQSNGKPYRAQVAAGALITDPVFQARVASGISVVPVVHSAAGYVWEGAPVSIQ